uniref:Uncharacterized protein n=1 Tax=viral metagenome TaxID=1070528 RepID=A0A6M3L9K8_9ZZZZ
MIGEYIPDDDDYVILESINKGIALGRLSMYQPEDMEIYKVNVDDWEALGKKATLALTRYGRCSYDFMLIIRLLIYAPIMLIKHGLPPWHPEELPYRRDNHFICTEAANRGWADIGYPFIPEGVIPMPASFKLALKRGRLLRVYPV